MAKKTVDIEELKERMRTRKPAQKVDYRVGLHSGSTMMNLACTGRADVAYLPGFYYLFVGDSKAGKTMKALAALAEAARNPVFANYQLVYDAVEQGALMDFRRYFGVRMAERVEAPGMTRNGSSTPSKTVQEFYHNLKHRIRRGPVLYVLDSMDGLVPEAEAKKREKKADGGGKGSYGTEKSKENSASLREVCGMLGENGSILIIVAQKRSMIGLQATFQPDTFSGGNALSFYATLIIWFRLVKRLRKELPAAGGKKLKLEKGILAGIKTDKNRETGKPRSVNVPIYADTGIDDLGASVEFLITGKHWQGSTVFGQGKVDAPEFEFKGSKDSLIKKIEDENREEELNSLTEELWHKLEEKVQVHRKSRYE